MERKRQGEVKQEMGGETETQEEKRERKRENEIQSQE